MKIFLIIFYFIVCIISSLDTLYGMKLLGKVEGDLLFLFSVDVFVIIWRIVLCRIRKLLWISGHSSGIFVLNVIAWSSK